MAVDIVMWVATGALFVFAAFMAVRTWLERPPVVFDDWQLRWRSARRVVRDRRKGREG